MDLDEQPTCVVQPLEVIVTESAQTTVTSNEEQISVHSNIPESGSDSDSLLNIPETYNTV